MSAAHVETERDEDVLEQGLQGLAHAVSAPAAVDVDRELRAMQQNIVSALAGAPFLLRARARTHRERERERESRRL